MLSPASSQHYAYELLSLKLPLGYHIIVISLLADALSLSLIALIALSLPLIALLSRGHALRDELNRLALRPYVL